MGPTTQLMTADELQQLPKNGNRYELVRGELRTMPPAGFEHGAVGVNLSTPLDSHVKAQGLGIVVAAETGFLLARDPDSVRAPDIGFVGKERLQAIGVPAKYFPGAPDLATEVISPGDTVFEVDEKVQEWLDAGTKLVWVVDPRLRTVTVYRPGAKPTILTENDILDGGDVVPGFRMAVKQIFVPS